MSGLNPKKIIIQNNRTTKMVLSLEPLGWYWEMEPGAVFEIFFDAPEDIGFENEPLVFDDRGVTFSNAYPSSVIWVLPNERRDMMK